MEEQITSTKEQRSKLKTRLTHLCKQLSGSIKRQDSNVNILFQNIEEVFMQFQEMQDIYSELVNSDSKYEPYKKVGGLDLTEYNGIVTEVYDDTVTTYNSYVINQKLDSMQSDTKLTIMRAGIIIDSIERHVNDSIVGLSLDSLINDAQSLIDTFTDTRIKMNKLDSGCSILSDIDNIIAALCSVTIKGRDMSMSSISADTPRSAEARHARQSQHANFSPRLIASETQSGRGVDAGGHTPEHFRSGVGRASTGSVLTPSMLGSNSRSRFTRSQPPSFAGNRAEWPEFRAVWRRYAELEFACDEERAWALKQTLTGRPASYVKPIYVTHPDAYHRMWERLESVYSDTSLSIRAIYDQLKKLKPVSDDNMVGLVELINEVELCHSQLYEIDQVDSITMTQVDDITDLLPFSTRKDWLKTYITLEVKQKIHPFNVFVDFLKDERDVTIRLAERQVKRTDNFKYSSNSNKTMHAHSAKQPQTDNTPCTSYKGKFVKCAVHTQTSSHDTATCREFKEQNLDKRLETLKKSYACFRCLGPHLKIECNSKDKCAICHKINHHSLLCRQTGTRSASKEQEQTSSVQHNMHASNDITPSLFAIQYANVQGQKEQATLFFDSGSNTTYITHDAAKHLRAKRLQPSTLNIKTMGEVEKSYDTHMYQITLQTTNGEAVKVKAYGMETITSPVSKVDKQVIQTLFPKYDPTQLERKATPVDLLVGLDYYGLHPRQEVDRAGQHLCIMQGVFGICLQGSHPRVRELTSIDANLLGTITSTVGKPQTFLIDNQTSHPEFKTPRHSVKDLHSFILGEELGTEVNPRCGGCRCSKCPIVGHTYSFKEEQELHMIRENLRYDSANQRWITKYPWIADPTALPSNYGGALATLRNTENTLRKDATWADTYHEQIQDMVERQVARKLSTSDLSQWKGPTFYISHLAVRNPKSKSTPVRIVFNSSQRYQGVSLNSFLAKGPDAYLNNLTGVLLRWRENRIALVSDIKKMYNSIYLEELEQHCHRFLWRNLDSLRDPDVYVVTRVNMGDRPAAAISTEALYMTASLFQDHYPRVASLLRTSTYVDDIVESVDSLDDAISMAKDTELVLAKAGFRIKFWQFSGMTHPVTNLDEPVCPTSMCESTQEGKVIQVLGVLWDLVSDNISFQPTLNFSPKKKGTHVAANVSFQDLPQAIPTKLTRRQVLEQVMRVYDPLGLLCPFMLKAKCLLRESWNLQVGWDDPLPHNLQLQWVEFFLELCEVTTLSFKRCLKPALAVGLPTLVIMSDGSDLAYGCTAYIRWTLQSGEHWCRLIMAKSRIAPKQKLSTPQMELNGAVLSKRLRAVLMKELRFEFEDVFQLVDSETVLAMINKSSTRYKVYEGVRVGEIQAATNGDTSCWWWLEGTSNVADWTTRIRHPHDLNTESPWVRGPDFLYKEYSEWGIRQCSRKIPVLPGEKKVGTLHVQTQTTEPLVQYTNFSSLKRLIWTLARVISILKQRSFKGGSTLMISKDIMSAAKLSILIDVQKAIVPELEKGRRGKYARLRPACNKQGIWVVGRRLCNYNPLASFPDAEPQSLLPSRHPFTRLVMMEAHISNGHRGRDATLATFRQQYWTTQGSKVARYSKDHCQQCRLREPQLLKYEEGLQCVERLKPAPPFTRVMLDLFGPYLIRGEVQKRTSGKVYGAIFTDMFSRAVHIEVIAGYDTGSFLLALTRFTSIRGWPEIIFSDPGSQLVSAEKELQTLWKSLESADIYKTSLDNGLTWKFGPPDAPWYQGAVESLVKMAKRALAFCMGSQRLSISEFLTVCTEVANIMNERPLGTIPSDDSVISILTPNSLLLGRSMAKNPGGWSSDSSTKTRQQMVTQITKCFWARWVELYGPTLYKVSKWHRSNRNLQCGDVVSVLDSNSLRPVYYIAIVRDVYPGPDGVVRRALVAYKNFRVGDVLSEYRGIPDTSVVRNVQRLALLVPVDGNGA